MDLFEFTDRYDALGIPAPDPNTMCEGDCEGTGWIPVTEHDFEYSDEWLKAEAEIHTKDGYHFVKCHQCGGTGKRAGS